MAAKTVVSLEVTQESVRAVEVTSGPNPSIVAFGEVPLPADAAKDSEVLDADAVALALHQLWAQASFSSHHVVLAVGNRRILVREFSTPLLPLDQLKASLPYQVQDLLPVPVDQAVLDFYPVAEENGTVQGLLVAAVSETMEDLVTALAKAKLFVERIDLVPFGLARVAKTAGAAGEAVAMIHIGEHTTHVVIAVDGVPRLVRTLPAEIATSDAARALEVLEDELATVSVTVGAETLGRAGLRVRSASPLLTAAPEGSIGDLAGRLRGTLSFYAERPGAQPIGGVFVSGAGAGNPAVVPALQRELDRAVRVVDVSSVAAARGAGPTGDLALNLVGTVGVVLGDGKKK